MKLVTEELHFYDATENEYRLKNEDFCEYKVLIVTGYKSLDSGSVNHVFVRGTDYEQRGDKIYWLGADTPAVPPSALGLEYIPFYATYLYENRPETTIRSSVYPFMTKDGTFTSVINAVGTQIYRAYQKKGDVVRSRNITTSAGEELDMIGSWYNTARYDGETDTSFRARLLDFLSTFLSSGTIASIISLMERTTGATPTIEEFWEQTSYYDYDPNDASSFWVYDDGASSNVATYYFFVNQPATFYVIFNPSDYSVFPTYGPTNLKKTLNSAKAEGTIGFIGYLTQESFGVNDNNWSRQTVVPSGTGDAADWSIDTGEYKYLDNTSTYHDGLSVISNTDYDDSWGDYQIMGYARDATGTANQMSGVVTRWQASGTDQYEFYIFGISAFDDKAYCYHWDGAAFNEKGASGGTAVSGGVDTSSNYHLRVDMRGNAATFYVNNVQMFSDPDDWDDLRYGRPGVACIDQSGTHAAQTAYFDDINVVV